MTSQQQINGNIMYQTLSSIFKRYCSAFFSKLIFYTDTSRIQQSTFVHIRHYDLQCQASQNIQSIITTAINRKKMNAFMMMKSHGHKRFKRTGSRSVCNTPRRQSIIRQSQDIANSVRVRRKGSVDIEREKFFSEKMRNNYNCTPKTNQIKYGSQRNSDKSGKFTELFNQIIYFTKRQLSVEPKNRQDARKKEKILGTMTQLETDIVQWINKKQQNQSNYNNRNTHGEKQVTVTTSNITNYTKKTHGYMFDRRTQQVTRAMRKYRPSLRQRKAEYKNFFDDI